MDDFPSLAGQLLIAMPAMRDPNFESSVTLICEHSADGAMGITINRPLQLTHGEVFAQMRDEQEANIDFATEKSAQPVISGGPMSPERGFVLHKEPGSWEATLTLGESLFVTLSRDVLQSMAQEATPSSAIMALGYAGWAASQLEQEILSNAWLTVPASHEIVFDAPYTERYTLAAQTLGVDLNQLSHDAGHA